MTKTVCIAIAFLLVFPAFSQVAEEDTSAETTAVESTEIAAEDATDEIDFGDIGIKPGLGLIDHSAPVKTDQLEPVFDLFRLLFLLRNQNIMLDGGNHLHGGDSRTR